MCQSVTQDVRLSDPSQTVSQLTPIGGAGVLFGFDRESEPKAKGGKNGFGKRNKQKIYLWLNKDVRGGMLSSPDQQFLLGALTLTPTFTCSQVDSLHLKVLKHTAAVEVVQARRGCTRPVHHMQIILHCKAARLSCHAENRMPFVTRFLRQTTTYRVK